MEPTEDGSKKRFKVNIDDFKTVFEIKDSDFIGKPPSISLKADPLSELGMNDE